MGASPSAPAVERASPSSPPTNGPNIARSPEVVEKIVLLGNTSVGKTALGVRWRDNTFTVGGTLSTIGVEVYMKKMLLASGVRMKVQVWDTAGAERFHSVATSYFRHSRRFLMVYDVTARESFDAVRRWLAEVEDKADPDSVVVLVANKIDDENRVVTRAEGESFSEDHGAIIRGYYEVSAKTGEGVDAVFDTLLQLALTPAASPPSPQRVNTVCLEPEAPRSALFSC